MSSGKRFRIEKPRVDEREREIDKKKVLCSGGGGRSSQLARE